MSDRGRKILFLMHYFHEDVVGGAEVQSYLLARELAAAGHDVVYLCDRLKKDTPRTEVRDGIRVWRWFRSLPLFKILNLPIFLWALLRFRPEAIYHRYASQYTAMGAVARLFGIRYVWNCCEDSHLQPNYFRNALREHFKTYGGNPLKKGLLYADAWLCDMLFPFGPRFASAPVAQNVAQQKGIMERWGKEARIIRSGHPHVEGIEPEGDRIEVLWLATLQKRKRPELFLDAAEACRDLPATFVLAGRTANESYRKGLLDRAESLPNIETRHVDSYELSWRQFERAYIYVCTSESEGFPNAFIQAWMCGVPVVSLGVNPDEFISRHKLGYVCGTVEELIASIRKLIEDRQLRDAMGNHARTVAREVFDIHNVAGTLEGVLLNQQRSGLEPVAVRS